MPAIDVEIVALRPPNKWPLSLNAATARQSLYTINRHHLESQGMHISHQRLVNERE